MIYKTGSFYSLYYTQWKKNIKIYAFILYGGPGVDKVHALNIGAVQLNIVDRAKLMRVLVQLMKIPASNKYTGAMLYRILTTYIKPVIKKCYRTYIKTYISKAALINYGLNKEEDFTELEKNFADKDLYKKATQDLIIKTLNLYSKRGVALKTVENSFAKPTIEQPIEQKDTTPRVTSAQIPTSKPKTNTGGLDGFEE